MLAIYANPGSLRSSASTRSATAACPGAKGWIKSYLSPAGERAPFLSLDVAGALTGMRLDHGREHLARA